MKNENCKTTHGRVFNLITYQVNHKKETNEKVIYEDV